VALYSLPNTGVYGVDSKISPYSVPSHDISVDANIIMVSDKLFIEFRIEHTHIK
jgi:hypothetical protein